MEKHALIFLHGALGSRVQFNRLTELLENDFSVYSFDLEGHGDSGSDHAFTMGLFSRNVLEFMEENLLEKASFFGYSMGGYVALNLALKHPEKVEKIVTLGTKLSWTPEIAAQEIRQLDPEKIEEKVPRFAAHLADLHGERNWKMLVRKTADMMQALGNGAALTDDQFAEISRPVLLLLAENDTMVTREETKNTCESLSDGSMQVLPEAKHPIDTVDKELLAGILRSFLH